ncbi:MAG: Unknown protein [uncultured Thiotrichaceae bacterium]|uniref:Uncharacterized protein n=1 Tax=uncultured Thiotrichaceae bacterium TaxID=298394 RepID=A0A6S6TW74_9GAMM|nr:MAG: Unknown protein [uncultured Thiotrichaceae bacterium]
MKNIANSFFRTALQNKPHLFILLFLLVLSCISFYTTYDGLIRFSYGSFDKTPIVFVVVLFLFVTVLQGMLLFSLFELLRSRIYLKAIWLIVYIVTMGVSVFFSYSFYYNLFRAESYAFDNFSSQLNRVKDSAQDYQDAFSQINADTVKLADYSRKRAEEERQFGGTCGYQSAPKAGPRSRYRDKEKRVFTALSDDITDLNKKVSADILQLEALVKKYQRDDQATENIQNSMNKIVQRVNGYQENGKLLNLSATLRDHMYEKRKTDGNHADGIPITCPDDNIDIKGTSILKQIEILPQVSDVELFDPDSDHQVLGRALTVFMQIPKALLPDTFWEQFIPEKNSDQAEATKITNLDYSPLILGGLIDLFIFIVGLADGLENRQYRWAQRQFKGRYIQSDDIPRFGDIANEILFIEHLRNFIYRDRWSLTIIIPSNPLTLPVSERGIFDLIEALEAFEILKRPQKQNLPFASLPPSMQTSFSMLFNDAQGREFTVYKLPTSLWRELQQAYYSHHLQVNKL